MRGRCDQWQQILKIILRSSGAFDHLKQSRSYGSFSNAILRPRGHVTSRQNGGLDFDRPKWLIAGRSDSVGILASPRLAFLMQQIREVKVLGSEVLKTQHTQQGRGGATIQVELRDLQSGLKSSERLRTSEAIEKAYIDERTLTFLYDEGESAILMDPNNYEQIEVPKSTFGNGAVYLKDGMAVIVHIYEGKPLSASVPTRVTCTVAKSEPYMKGETQTPTYKRIVLENGQQIMAPAFVVSGDQIVVDTTDNSYVTRAKNTE